MTTATSPLTTATGGHDTVTVVLAAHGSKRRPDANAVIAGHAAEMRRSGPFQRVSTVFLMGDDTAPRDAIRAAGDGVNPETVLIVPFMMSDGFLSEALSAQIRESLHTGADNNDPPARVIVTPPVGTHEGITRIVRNTAERTLVRAGRQAADATLILVAHGSKGRPESRLSAEYHADRLRAGGAFAAVELAMLEEPPLLGDVFAATRGPAVVVGLFAAPGGHAVDDVRDAIRRTGNPDIVDAGPVGVDPRMAEIAVLRALDALNN